MKQFRKQNCEIHSGRIMFGQETEVASSCWNCEVETCVWHHSRQLRVQPLPSFDYHHIQSPLLESSLDHINIYSACSPYRVVQTRCKSLSHYKKISFPITPLSIGALISALKQSIKEHEHGRRRLAQPFKRITKSNFEDLQ